MKKRNIEDFIGKKYNRLTVLSEAPFTFSANGRKKYRLLCRCDCGTEKPVALHQVIHGQTKSCGCLINERIREANSIHGDTRDYKLSPEYRSWIAMKARCLYPKSVKYSRYGARGITVCPEWIESYAAFLADMGRKPTPEHTLDRIENNGNYERGNCRWATPAQQRANQNPRQSKGATVEFRGETKTILEWARQFSVPSTTIYHRINKGWPTEKALTSPVKPRKNFHKQIW